MYTRVKKIQNNKLNSVHALERSECISQLTESIMRRVSEPANTLASLLLIKTLFKQIRKSYLLQAALLRWLDNLRIYL